MEKPVSRAAKDGPFPNPAQPPCQSRARKRRRRREAALPAPPQAGGAGGIPAKPGALRRPGDHLARSRLGPDVAERFAAFQAGQRMAGAENSPCRARPGLCVERQRQPHIVQVIVGALEVVRRLRSQQNDSALRPAQTNQIRQGRQSRLENDMRFVEHGDMAQIIRDQLTSNLFATSFQ